MALGFPVAFALAISAALAVFVGGLSAADRLQGDVHRHRQLSADGRALLHPGRRADVGRR
jgi:hypothetical protein